MFNSFRWFEHSKKILIPGILSENIIRLISFSKASWIGFYLTPSHRLNHRGKKKKKNQQAIAKLFSTMSVLQRWLLKPPRSDKLSSWAYTRILYLSHIFKKKILVQFYLTNKQIHNYNENVQYSFIGNWLILYTKKINKQYGRF